MQPATMPAMAPPLSPLPLLLPASWPCTVIEPGADTGSVLMAASGCPFSRVEMVAFRNFRVIAYPAALVKDLMPGAMTGHICARETNNISLHTRSELKFSGHNLSAVANRHSHMVMHSPALPSDCCLG